MGLDGLPLLLEVVQQLVVMLVEDDARDGVQPRHDVPSACRILAALQPRPELPWRRRTLSVSHWAQLEWHFQTMGHMFLAALRPRDEVGLGAHTATKTGPLFV